MDRISFLDTCNVNLSIVFGVSDICFSVNALGVRGCFAFCMFIMNFSVAMGSNVLIICLSSDLCSLCCVSGVPLPAECVVERTGVTQVSQRAVAAQCSRVRLTLTLKGVRRAPLRSGGNTHITDFSHSTWT